MCVYLYAQQRHVDSLPHAREHVGRLSASAQIGADRPRSALRSAQIGPDQIGCCACSSGSAFASTSAVVASAAEAVKSPSAAEAVKSDGPVKSLPPMALAKPPLAPGPWPLREVEEGGVEKPPPPPPAPPRLQEEGVWAWAEV